MMNDRAERETDLESLLREMLGQMVANLAVAAACHGQGKGRSRFFLSSRASRFSSTQINEAGTHAPLFWMISAVSPAAMRASPRVWAWCVCRGCCSAAVLLEGATKA